MPGHTRTGCYGTELVDDVAWNEINIIVTQSEPGIAHTITAELVQFSLLDPLTTLQ